MPSEAALRDDPDVILVGELRDFGTIQLAIHGRRKPLILVFRHAPHQLRRPDGGSAWSTCFPPPSRPRLRVPLSGSLAGDLCPDPLPAQRPQWPCVSAGVMAQESWSKTTGCKPT